MRIRLPLFIGILLLIVPSVTFARAPQLSLAGVLSPLDGDFGAPADWAGIWEREISVYECSLGQFMSTFTDTVTICAGDPFYVSDSEGPVVCSGTVTGTSVNIDCGWTVEVPAGCVVSSNVSMVGTRSGESYQMTQTVDATYVGETCGFVGEICFRMEITGTRIAPQPPTCDTPVEDTSWGRVKALYR